MPSTRVCKIHFFTYRRSIYLKLKKEGQIVYPLKRNTRINSVETFDYKQCIEFKGQQLTKDSCQRIAKNLTTFLNSLPVSNQVAGVFIWNGGRLIDSIIKQWASKRNYPTLYFEIANIPGKIQADPCESMENPALSRILKF